MPEIELPKTVEQAVSQLMTELSIYDKQKIKNTPKDSLSNLHFSLGMNIRNAFGLWSGNEELLKSCRLITGKKDLHVDDASSIIINALWERLQKYPSLLPFKSASKWGLIKGNSIEYKIKFLRTVSYCFQ